MPTKSEKFIRKEFKSIFRISEKKEGGLRGGFNLEYIKQLGKTQKGLDQIKQLYDDLTTNPKVIPIITGKSLEEALNFSSTNDQRFATNLENWIKKGDS